MSHLKQFLLGLGHIRGMRHTRLHTTLHMRYISSSNMGKTWKTKERKGKESGQLGTGIADNKQDNKQNNEEDNEEDKQQPVNTTSNPNFEDVLQSILSNSSQSIYSKYPSLGVVRR